MLVNNPIIGKASRILRENGEKKEKKDEKKEEKKNE